MPKTYITFGQGHVHTVNDKVFDKDCIAVVEAIDRASGRQLAFDLFGLEFCFEYHDTEFDPDMLKYFPRGLLSVEAEDS